MLVRRTLASLLGALFVLAGLAVANTAGAEELGVGTLAPKASPWGKVFTVWGKALEKKTDGKLTLRWYFNGAAGDEAAMIDKMKTGQLDGAAVTSVGLSKVNKNFLALQSPGLCTTWACVDRVRDGVMAELQKGAEGAGFFVMGKGDVGLARTFSKGKAIRSPSDLKAMKVYQWDADPVAPTTARVLGFTGVPSSVPSLLPALTSGRINTATVPSLAATQLQWANHFDHVTDSVAAGVVGGLMFSKKKVDALPGDLKEELVKTGKKAGDMLTERIRKEDAAAYELVAKKMTVVKLSADEEGVWKKKFKEVRTQLGQGTFPAAFMSKLESLAGK